MGADDDDVDAELGSHVADRRRRVADLDPLVDRDVVQRMRGLGELVVRVVEFDVQQRLVRLRAVHDALGTRSVHRRHVGDDREQRQAFGPTEQLEPALCGPYCELGSVTGDQEMHNYVLAAPGHQRSTRCSRPGGGS